MQENKQLAEYIFDNRPNKQTYILSWSFEELEEDKWEKRTHSKFLDMANKLLEVTDFETAKNIIDLKLHMVYQ